MHYLFQTCLISLYLTLPLPLHFHKGLHRASSSLTILNILNVLTIFKHFMIIVSLDPDWGLGSDLLCYVVHFTAITGCSYYILCQQSL